MLHDAEVAASVGYMEEQPDGGRKMSVISMKQLLEAGVHFGHQTRRWKQKQGRHNAWNHPAPDRPPHPGIQGTGKGSICPREQGPQACKGYPG